MGGGRRTEHGKEEGATPQPGRVAAPAFLPPVPLADLVRRHGRKGRNSERYRLVATVFGRRVYPGSLLADVAVAPRNARTATLLLPLDGGYERLTATLARDDVSAAAGPGAAHFEVYGDGRLLFRTAAPLIPVGSPIRTPKGSPVRPGPEPIAVAVHGVRRLEIVTRYAFELSQEGPGVTAALGCVWAEALLAPSSSKAADGRARDRRGELRAALQPGVLRLASAAALAGARAAPAPLCPPLTLAVFVAPVPPEGGQGAPESGELRAALWDVLREPRFGGSVVFAPLDRGRSRDFEREARRLAVAAGPAALSVAARGTGATAVLLASPVPPPHPTAPWSLILRALLLPAPDRSSRASSLPDVVVTLPTGV